MDFDSTKKQQAQDLQMITDNVGLSVDAYCTISIDLAGGGTCDMSGQNFDIGQLANTLGQTQNFSQNLVIAWSSS